MSAVAASSARRRARPTGSVIRVTVSGFTPPASRIFFFARCQQTERSRPCWRTWPAYFGRPSNQSVSRRDNRAATRLYATVEGMAKAIARRHSSPFLHERRYTVREAACLADVGERTLKAALRSGELAGSKWRKT